MSNQEEEINELKTDLKQALQRIEALEKLQAKFEGAGWFIKIFFFVAVPAFGGFAVWAKDHIKW